MSLRNFVYRFLSLAAGEAGRGPDLQHMPHTGKIGEVREGSKGTAAADHGDDATGKPLIDGDDDDQRTDDDDQGSAPGDAGRTAGERTDSEDDDDKSKSDDDGDDDDGESAGADTNTAGDGADEDDGVDPAVGLSIQRNWESRFDAQKDKKVADPLAMVRSAKLSISDEVKAKVKAAFEKEDDVGAIVEVVSTLVPQLLQTYDESRVTPILTEHQVSLRNARIVRAVADFDEAHEGARTPKITAKMATLYDTFKGKYGYQYADDIPVEDYFYMAGGSLRKKGGSKAGGTAPAAPSKAEIEEQRKDAALASSRQPERIGKPKGTAANGGKPSKKSRDAAEVDEFVKGLATTHFDPFVIR